MKVKEHISVIKTVRLALHLNLNSERGFFRCFRIAFLLRRLLNKLYAMGITNEQIDSQLKNA